MGTRLICSTAGDKMYSVFVAHLPAPTTEALKDGLRRGLAALGRSLPQGRRIFVQPACPWAHPRFAPYAFTSLQFMDAIYDVFQGNTLQFGTNALPGFPARYGFQQAGYARWARRRKTALLPLDEVTYIPDADGIRWPHPVVESDLLIALPKLSGSGFLGLAGAMRHHMFLLSPQDHLSAYPDLPEKMLRWSTVRPPDLIVMDAVHVTHRGGEVSGEPLGLSLLIMGTNMLAVDMIAALAYGWDPMDLPWLRTAALRGLGPSSLSMIRLTGDLSIEDLRQIGQRVIHPDPAPERYPWPSQIRIYRSEKEPLWNIPGSLMETIWILEHGKIPLSRSREAAIIIGSVGELGRPRTDTAAAILLGDTARADYRGYSRIVRFPGSHVPVARLLLDLPYVLRIASMRSELGLAFLWASIVRSWRNRIRP